MNRGKKHWNAAEGIFAAGALFVFFILAAPAQEPKLFQLEDLSGALVLLYERTHESFDLDRFANALQDAEALLIDTQEGEE